MEKDATNNNMGLFQEIGDTNKENHARNKPIGLTNVHETRNDVFDINNSESEESEYEAGSEELLQAKKKRKKKLKKKFEFEQSLKQIQTEKKLKRKEKIGTDEQFEWEEEREEDEVNKIDSEVRIHYIDLFLKCSETKVPINLWKVPINSCLSLLAYVCLKPVLLELCSLVFTEIWHNGTWSDLKRKIVQSRILRKIMFCLEIGKMG